jgi:hypothetical protein
MRMDSDRWSWIETQVERTIDLWNECPGRGAICAPAFTAREQLEREHAYDQALAEVESETAQVLENPGQRSQSRSRLLAAFARFSALALDLEQEATEILTRDLVPAGLELAARARSLDPELSMAGII